jgi:uncharacterized protein (TIGR02246 family)
MRNHVIFSTLVLLCVGATIRGADQESGIQALFKQFVESWNRHDPRGVSLVFSPDADFTNWRGQHVRGRAAIEERLHPMFSGPIFQNSIVSGQVRTIRFLRPDIAVVDIDWEMTGARTAEGSPRPKRQGLLDWVCEKRGQDWQIVVFHDTDFTGASAPVK